MLQLSPGQASDIVAASDLILGARASRSRLADRAYDDALRRMLIERGTATVIPNKINRVNRHPFDPAAYRLRNAVERAFCRLKDFRAIATRYDKTARNYLAGQWLVEAIIWTLSGPAPVLFSASSITSQVPACVQRRNWR